MIQDSDIDSAVSKGLLSRDAARKLRNHAAESRGASAADEERFSVTSSLADIMTCVGLLLIFLVAFQMLFSISPPATLTLAPILWVLAEYFTRRRKQFFASLLLFAIFVLSIGMAMVTLGLEVAGPDQAAPTTTPNPTGLPPLVSIFIAAGIVMACAGWWWRFKLPIAYAAGVVALINLMIHVARIAAPDIPTGAVSILLLLIGLAIFALAMWWDISDIRRETSRSDVAFWLHVAAGYQIAASAYRLLFGVVGPASGWERLYRFTVQSPTGNEMIVAALIFIIFCWIAVIIDRRSLLMSSIAFLVQAIAAPPYGKALTTNPLAIIFLGSLVVLLSVLWQKVRALALAPLPSVVQAQLPRQEVSFRDDRPVY
ncbi:hypothetical protein [Sphingobium sp. CCH11-B1]|uniref:hypothetical protein n=1 Tax=Sphingobium sp. CCH11-B1 TaxID=1768781 RepID=UPI000AD18A7E|nr:hypothetical protein [Sphingobium sp. CCH11-B1]MEA3389350.1 hypothetical protein [Pseudomonadota bacterium]